MGGFLNRYDFAYVGRDTVNQAAKVACGVIKNAGNEINNIAKERINQIITQGGKEAERVLPKILQIAQEFWETTAQQTKKKNIKCYFFHFIHIIKQ